MARRSSGLSGFIEQEHESKCYSFPSALIISEVCDIEQLFPFSSGLQTSSPVKPSILFHIYNRYHRADFSPCMGIHENCLAFASYCTHFCIYRNLIQLPK